MIIRMERTRNMHLQTRLSLYLVVCILSLIQLLLAEPNFGPQSQANANAASYGPNSAQASASANLNPNPAGVGNDQRRFEDFKRSPMFLDPFDPKVLSLPDEHLNFLRNASRHDVILYREILHEAISSRHKVGPSVRLMLKYSGRVLSTVIKNRRGEKKLTRKIEPKPEFYTMIADMCHEAVQRSEKLKKNYSKKRLDIQSFRLRVDAIFEYLDRLINISPLGAYMKWDQCVLYRDQPRNGIQNKRLMDEVSELLAQFRVMGYEPTMFVVKRLINLLRMFARGIVPNSEKEV